jgi:hypothetical protein
MRNNKALMAFATAIALGVLGAGSLAQASDNSGEYAGGFKIGPLGQHVGPWRPWSVWGVPAAAQAYGFASPNTQKTRPQIRRPAHVQEDN